MSCKHSWRAWSAGIERPFTRLPDTLHLGPSGARLWATYVLPEPGLRGSFEFIHKVNAPELFWLTLTRGGKAIRLTFRSHSWHPSHLETVFDGDAVKLLESKFITWDDCAVDVVTVTNTGDSRAELSLEASSDMGAEWSFEAHGERVWVCTGCSASFAKLRMRNGSLEPGRTGVLAPERRGVLGPGRNGVLASGRNGVLRPGESATWVVVSALALSYDEADAAMRRWLGLDDALAVHCEEYGRFFEDAPSFECSDPAFEKMWEYRWYLLRRNLASPRCGNLPHPLYYEGRGIKMTLEPWNPQGWEFSRLIPFSTGVHLLEGRWHPDASPCKGEVLDLVEKQREDGLFRCLFIDGEGSAYTDLTAWAAWQLYLVHVDREWLAQVGPGLVRQVDGTLATYDQDHDFLPTVYNHGSTGKEYQPSFFLKSNYPDHPPKEQATPLERVDASCYLYMNATAAALVMMELGDTSEAARMGEIAGRTRDAIIELMWDPEKRFFYDIDAVLHDRIPVENVVGFDPFMAGIAGEDYLAAFDRLTDPEQFGTQWPVPSTTLQSPAYAPDATWNGEHIKGPHGCVWNGPTWPFTNSTVLMALGEVGRSGERRVEGEGKGNLSPSPSPTGERSRSASPTWEGGREAFARLLRSYTMMCFRDGDIDDPIIYEHYDPETGQPISQEEDYLHSTWIDLIVRYVAGITPMPGGRVEFRPIDCGFERFSLRNVQVAGHRVDVEYDCVRGYSASVDGIAT